ncbi:MAG: potassium channel family protein [Planctomycetota bacterium]
MRVLPLKPKAPHRFLFLLIALLALLTAAPLAMESVAGQRWFSGAYLLVLIAGLSSMRRSTLWFVAGAFLVAPGVIQFMGDLSPGPDASGFFEELRAWSTLSLALYLALLIGFIFRDLFSFNLVTVDRLLGALSGYVLLGILFGSLFQALEIFRPGAFVGVSTFEPSHLASGGDPGDALYYFSFVTLTTLGYGDISPVSAMARMLVVWEAVLGQAFMTILVARLVGLHVSGAAQPQRSAESAQVRSGEDPGRALIALTDAARPPVAGE